MSPKWTKTSICISICIFEVKKEFGIFQPSTNFWIFIQVGAYNMHFFMAFLMDGSFYLMKGIRNRQEWTAPSMARAILEWEKASYSLFIWLSCKLFISMSKNGKSKLWCLTLHLLLVLSYYDRHISFYSNREQWNVCTNFKPLKYVPLYLATSFLWHMTYLQDKTYFNSVFE